MRKIVSIATISLLVAGSLAGCSSASQSASADTKVPVVCKALNEGSNVKAVSVLNGKSGVPQAKFPLPLKVGVSQRKILKQGTGTLFGGGQQIVFDFAGYNARTGELFQATKFDGTDAISQLVSAPAKGAAAATTFCNVLSGAREGATVLTLMNAADSHGSQAIENAGIKANDPILFVLKLRKVNLPRAIGTAQAPQSGFPQVVLGSTGEPGLVMQDWSSANAPTEFKKETLIKGSGALVHENDTVTVHYTGFVWDSSKTKFDSSWTNGSPATFQISRGSVIPGFISAIAGETVGSQVVAVLPPSVAYGSQATGSIPANATLIFVIDILGASK